MGQHRCFIAINLPDNVRDYIEEVVQKVAQTYPSFAYVVSSGIHITLNFLGDIDERAIQNIEAVLGDVVPHYSSIRLGIGNFGYFPNWKSPRVLFLNVREIGASQLIELQKTLTEKLSLIGIEPDYKPWHSHLTIARIKNSVSLDLAKLEKLNSVSGLEFEVKNISLMENHLSRSGAKYEILYSIPLSSS